MSSTQTRERPWVQCQRGTRAPRQDPLEVVNSTSFEHCERASVSIVVGASRACAPHTSSIARHALLQVASRKSPARDDDDDDCAVRDEIRVDCVRLTALRTLEPHTLQHCTHAFDLSSRRQQATRDNKHRQAIARANPAKSSNVGAPQTMMCVTYSSSCYSRPTTSRRLLVLIFVCFAKRTLQAAKTRSSIRHHSMARTASSLCRHACSSRARSLFVRSRSSSTSAVACLLVLAVSRIASGSVAVVAVEFVTISRIHCTHLDLDHTS